MLYVRLFAFGFVLCLLVSCGPQGQNAPSAPTPPPSAAAQRVEPPTVSEVMNATYIGLANGQITMKDGQWEKDKAFAALLEGFLIAGDLDRDGGPESVVIISEGVRGGPVVDYLAVLSRRGGQIVNLSTVKIGPPVQIRSAAVENASVNLNVIRAGSNDQPCCPTEKATLTYSMPAGALAKANEIAAGTATLSDVAGTEWLLVKFSATEPVSADTVAYFRVESGKVVGKGPCNTFTAPAVGEPTGLKIKINAIVATKMACAGPKQPLEDRFFKQLESTSTFSFTGGRLLAHYGDKGPATAMVFTSRPITKTPVPPSPPAGDSGS